MGDYNIEINVALVSAKLFLEKHIASGSNSWM